MWLASDDDDDARLIEADALLAKGDPRGELIVVQCQLARGGHSRERGITLRKRELELLLRHENEWAQLDGLARNWTYRRGFVDEITIEVARFVDCEEEIWRRAPYLRWLRFTGLGYDSPVDDLGDAAREWDKVQPRLERALASGLVRYFVPTDAVVSWMNDSPNFRYRETGSLTPAIVRWLAAEPAILGRLRGLALWNMRRHDFAVLAATPESAGLEEIELLGDLTEVDLAASRLRPRRARLLHSRDTRDDVGPLEDILASAFSERLTDLETVHIRPVLDSGCAAQLRTLHVSSVFDLAELEVIVDSPLLSKLEHLAVTGNYGGLLSFDTEPFFRAKGLDSLRTLRLGSGVSIAAARRLVRSPLAARLEEIDLRGSNLEPHALELRSLWDGFLLL